MNNGGAGDSGGPLHPSNLIRQNSGYSLQHSQVLQMKYQPTRTSSVTGSSPSINVSSLPTNYLAQLPSNWQAYPPPHQQQIIQQLVSRNSASPHHRARMAAAMARNTSATTAAPSNTNANNASGSSTSMMAILGGSDGPTNNNNATASVGSIGGDGSVGGINSSSNANANANGSGNTSVGWTALDLGGMGVRNISLELFNFSFLTSLYLNHNGLTSLPSSISVLRQLSYLDVSGNALKGLPEELGHLTNLKEFLVFDNLLTSLPFTLGSLYQLEFLGLEGNRLVEPILSFYQKQGTAAVISFLRDNAPVIHPPLEREWIMVETPASSPNEAFTVMTYNILNDKYATQQAYGYTPSWALEWDYRKELILQEILSLNADIICLQEVETSQFDEYFREKLSTLSDYSGVFFAKSRSRTMTEREKKNVDGCAIFYRNSKFQMMECQNLEFNQLCVSRPDFRKTDDMYNRVMTKDNVAIITRLETREPIDLGTGERGTLLIGNVHIHWDPMHKDVKLVQSAILAEEMEKHVKKHPKAAVMLCGDFNSMPGSGVYEFLTHGSLVPDHEDFGPHSYEPYTSQGLKHVLPLKSAYSSSIGELEFTNYTPSFSGVIDYIWFSHSSLSVTSVLGGVAKEYTDKVVGFPNAHFPSDHICLMSELKWRASIVGGSGVGNSANNGNNFSLGFNGTASTNNAASFNQFIGASTKGNTSSSNSNNNNRRR